MTLSSGNTDIISYIDIIWLGHTFTESWIQGVARRIIVTSSKKNI